MSSTAWLVWVLVISAASFVAGYQLARYLARDEANRVAVDVPRARQALVACRVETAAVHRWVAKVRGEEALVRGEREAVQAEREVVEIAINAINSVAAAVPGGTSGVAWQRDCRLACAAARSRQGEACS